ncbi:MAG: hypothetical protein HYX52_00920 [Chloroflexi bacterium]|nr:hypothetical protein [Chloroflexota bacterium]
MIDAHGTRSAGVVLDAVLDLEAGQLVGLDVAHGNGMLATRVPLDEIETIEPRVVRLRDVRTATRVEPRDWGEHTLSTSDVFGLLVLSDEGEDLGRIRDVNLRTDDLAILSYEIQGRLKRLTPDHVLAGSRDALIVQSQALARPATTPWWRPQPLPFLRRA